MPTPQEMGLTENDINFQAPDKTETVESPFSPEQQQEREKIFTAMDRADGKEQYFKVLAAEHLDDLKQPYGQELIDAENLMYQYGRAKFDAAATHDIEMPSPENRKKVKDAEGYFVLSRRPSGGPRLELHQNLIKQYKIDLKMTRDSVRDRTGWLQKQLEILSRAPEADKLGYEQHTTHEIEGFGLAALEYGDADNSIEALDAIGKLDDPEIKVILDERINGLKDMSSKKEQELLGALSRKIKEVQERKKEKAA